MQRVNGVFTDSAVYIVSNEFFYLMSVLLYLLSDTAAPFLQLNQLVADHSTCACTCASRVIRAL